MIKILLNEQIELIQGFSKREDDYRQLLQIKSQLSKYRENPGIQFRVSQEKENRILKNLSNSKLECENDITFIINLSKLKQKEKNRQQLENSVIDKYIKAKIDKNLMFQYVNKLINTAIDLKTESYQVQLSHRQEIISFKKRILLLIKEEETQFTQILQTIFYFSRKQFESLFLSLSSKISTTKYSFQYQPVKQSKYIQKSFSKPNITTSKVLPFQKPKQSVKKFIRPSTSRIVQDTYFFKVQSNNRQYNNSVKQTSKSKIVKESFDKELMFSKLMRKNNLIKQQISNYCNR